MKTDMKSFLLRLLQHFGPVLLAGLLIFLLTGGFPPANWGLLGKTLLHYSSYQAAQGSSLETPLIILCIQSVLLLLVGICWMVLFLRELRAFLNGPTQVKTTRAPVNIAPQAPVRVPRSAPAALKNPFENLARQRQNTGTITLSKTAAAKEEQLRKAQLASANAKPVLPAPASPGLAARPILPPPVSVKDEVVLSASVPDKSNDPFDVQFDLMDSFEPPDILVGTPSASTSPAPKRETPASTFVFGNPFEGDLPEVFEYDADLKQSLTEMQQNPSAPLRPAHGQKKSS
jgi:hypothetical protein